MGRLKRWLGLERQGYDTGVASPFVESSHLEAVTWAHLLDLEVENGPVTRADAMSIPAVARGRNMITGQAGRLAWEAVRGGQVLPSPLMDQPENGRPRALTMAWTVDALLFFGHAWFQDVETYAGDRRPYRVEWLPEYRVQVGQDGAILVDGQAPRSRVWRIDGPHEGLLNYGRESLRAARALSRAAGRAADNPVPSIDLHQTAGERMTPAQIDELVTRWVKARRSKNGAVGYTTPNLEARVLGAPPEQLLVAGRKAAALECANMLNLPAWAVDAEVSGTSLTYSTLPARNRELLDVTLAPYLDAIAGRLSMDDILAHGVTARAVTTALTQPDFGQRMLDYKAAQEAGVYTQDECRAMEHAGVPAPAIETTTTEDDQ